MLTKLPKQWPKIAVENLKTPVSVLIAPMQVHKDTA